MLEKKFVLPRKGVEFIDQIDSPTERKIESMKKGLKNRTKVKDYDNTIRLISERNNDYRIFHERIKV